MVEHSWSASWETEDGGRQFWRCEVHFAKGDPQEPIDSWVADEFLPVLVPTLREAPVSIALIFARHEGA